MKNTFQWLNMTQFTGALNDNAFKMLAVMTLANLQGPDSLTSVLAGCSALFILPFLLFSNAAGSLADRYSKRTIIIASKWLEVGLLILAIPAFLSGLAWPLYTLLFLLCTQSALFGPAKRGIIPELVEEGALSKANAQLTAATYTAIILGTALPALLVGFATWSPVTVLVTCLILALGGTFTAYQLKRVPTTGVVRKSSCWIIPDVVRAVRSLNDDTYAKQALFGLALFGAVTALFQQTLVIFSEEALQMPVERSPILFPLAALGIGIGALLTGRFSRHTIELGLVPLGALGVMVSLIALSLSTSTGWVAFWIINIGISCGLYLVPLNAFLQQRIKPQHRGEVFGAAGFLSFSAMVLASGLFYLLHHLLRLDARLCLLATGALASLSAVTACLRLPDFLSRFILMRLTRRCYRIKPHGLENLPREGGALIVANHIGYADALLLQAITQRRIRFVMSRAMYHRLWLVRPLLKLSGIIPIHTTDGPRALIKSFQACRQILDDGGVICIFPEGELTLTGNLQQFHKGFEYIVKGTDHPIIPIYMGNVWGSLFTYKQGALKMRKPDQFPRPIHLHIGPALAANSSVDHVRLAVEELGADYATARANSNGKTLASELLKVARRHWNKRAISDTTGMDLTYGKLLIAATALTRRIRPLIKHCRHVGILMPTSATGAIVNLALTLQGKTVVNINWTASQAALETAVKESRMKYCITSRRFLQKIEMPPLNVTYLYLEDLLKNLRTRERLFAFRHARFSRLSWFTGHRELKPSDTAAVIFSSGSTGTPKGVMLTHANILSNITAASDVISFGKNDAMCAILPLFHSFGYLANLWWPLLSGFRVACHPNPLQAGRVVKLIKEEQLTAILATPTFLQGFMRKAAPDDFATLNTVITGGEKLRPELADRFEAKFGIRPLEAYGATELSPAAAISTPNRHIANWKNRGHKAGSAGHTLPGSVAKTIDPETGKDLPLGATGILLIKGPNVMKGYLNQEAKTAEVIKQGWYNTGDMARIDADGFIFLTGRLARFSKIGGEMIPHGAIEEALQQTIESDAACVAVIGITDPDKGEQLAVCYTDAAGSPESLLDTLKAANLPNLWIPRIKNFFHLPELPLLGTGKLDLQALKSAIQ
jgi:acyl-[acyl-carrier-protein]-phospholipid O-acyltransferase / long-chain-fatty-acid--[acyl-carrier-protein] ligase